MDEIEKFIAFHDIELSRVNYRILDGVAKIYGHIIFMQFDTKPILWKGLFLAQNEIKH